ncbi:MAG: hypothetical protein QOI59_2392, partial [Gammaproteobacteria bacterium]|nr:hypothetical protein [Gammaproteobacteria bacterium]
MATVRNRIVLAASLLVLGWSPCALALNPALDVSQYAHTAWRVGEGVLPRPVVAIAQTPDGYLWLATEAGLLRFDGIRSVPWQPPSDQRLPSNRITWLLSARDGTLWVGTDKGLASWKAGRLLQHTELAGRAISKVVEDHDGVIWTTAGNYATNKWVLCSIRDHRVECYGEEGGPGAGAIDIYEDTRGILWAGTIGASVERANGLWRWKAGAPKFYPLPPKVNGIQGLSEDNNGALLVSWPGGVMRLSDAGEAVMRYPFPPSMLQVQPIRLLRDRDGGLWVGSLSKGLVHMHEGRRDAFAQADGLSGDAIWTLFEDREGDIWVATIGGLDRFHDVAAVTYSVKQGFSSSRINSLLASRDGTIWAGTSDGLNKWDNGQATVFRKRGTGTPVSPEEGARTIHETNSPELPSGDVESIFEDARGRVWFSTARGVGYFENGRFISVPGLPGGITRAISTDQQSNTWVAHQELGLFRVPSYGADIARIPWANLNHRDAPSAMTSDPSRDGLWLGFVGGGIVYLQNGKIESSYTTRDGLGDGQVRNLHFDHDGTLWAATDGGLSRLKNGRV